MNLRSYKDMQHGQELQGECMAAQQTALIARKCMALRYHTALVADVNIFQHSPEPAGEGDHRALA